MHRPLFSLTSAVKLLLNMWVGCWNRKNGNIFPFESVGHSSLFISSYYIQMTKILSHVPLLCRVIFYHSYHFSGSIHTKYRHLTHSSDYCRIWVAISSHYQWEAIVLSPMWGALFPLWFCAACDIVILPPGQSDDGDDHDFLSCDWGKLWSFLVFMSLLSLVSGEAALRCLGVAC